MILYGRNLSPFVRRVAIWCALQGREVERRTLAATDPADAEAIRAVHPGLRVPALALDDGAVLIDSAAICDWLDETGEPRLIPASGLARRDAMQRIALANATSEKIVAMVYERNRRPEALHWTDWQDRLTAQIRGGFAALEIATGEGLHGGDRPDGADVVTVCAYQMAEATNPWLLDPGYPKIAALAEACMGHPGFAETDPRG